MDDPVKIDFPENGINFYQAVDEFEKALMMKALLMADWNYAKASRLLNVPRGTFNSMLKKKGIEKPSMMQFVGVT